jgi:hypothetical protein
VRAPVALLAAVVAFAGMAGCGGDRDTGGTAPVTTHRQSTAPVATHGQSTAPVPAHRQRPRRETVERATCPSGVPACRSAQGRITYVERVDPDGDGDAHFVILDAQGITLPGLTAIDVRRGLRPQPLPGPGDLISAAGPVQTGSYGQHQIHALVVHVAGRDG